MFRIDREVSDAYVSARKIGSCTQGIAAAKHGGDLRGDYACICIERDTGVCAGFEAECEHRRKRRGEDGEKRSWGKGETGEHRRFIRRAITGPENNIEFSGDGERESGLNRGPFEHGVARVVEPAYEHLRFPTGLGCE